MILKGSQRSGGKQLGLHLLKTVENEHVEIHDVSGFVSESVLGAMNEAYALSRGTHCKQYLFSLSLSPPETESVRVEVFERAIAAVEERLGLKGQPRVIVFHEKEGRRHCHAVWSRIDAETMKAKHLPHFGFKLRQLAKELFLENGWNMPKGYQSPKLRDPRSFTLDEWQKAKRAGIDPREMKAAVNDCYSRADGMKAFSAALEERGLFLARGDRRAFVVVTIDGDAYSVSRMIPERVRDIKARLGDPEQLPSVTEAMKRVAADIAPRLKGYIDEARQIARHHMKPLVEAREATKVEHQAQRRAFDQRLADRWNAEQRIRSARTRKGFAGVWDFLTGRYFKIRKQNELEVQFARERDNTERHQLILRQQKDRQALQDQIRQARRKEAERVLSLYRDAAKFRQMREERGASRERDNGLDLG